MGHPPDVPAAEVGACLERRGPDGTAVSEWPLWTTCARVVVTDPATLTTARGLVRDYLAEVDDAANRFRADSEIRRLAGGGEALLISATLADLLEQALEAAVLTHGDVDPTVGAPLRSLGHDSDLRLFDDGARRPHAVVRPVAGYRSVRLTGRLLRMPPGVELDLGATARAVAADRAAALVHARLGTGVLVSLGGDIATAGPSPRRGWQVRVQDRAEDPATQVALASGTAIATSSTVSRQRQPGGRSVHHVVDPRTGAPTDPYWRSVTVAASTCLRANAVTTAALVRGPKALGWVRDLGLPARFLRHDGRVAHTEGWPHQDHPGAA